MIPIVSALVAVIALVYGVFVFLTYKQNVRGRETADFDFIFSAERDEHLEYKTVWERLLDDIKNALPIIRTGQFYGISETSQLINNEVLQEETPQHLNYI